MTDHAAMIEGSDARIMRSELTGKDYLISVSLPYGYHDEPEKQWPVVYLLDGNVYFGMITEIVRSMAGCGPTSGAIVIGIGYATDAAFDQAWDERLKLRYHDLTPLPDELDEKAGPGSSARAGGAKDFMAFIHSELMPRIEANYRIDAHERTLAGHSHAGLFTLFALLHNPSFFRNYVACSPTIFFKGQVTLEMEKAFAREKSALPARLFLSMGALEQRTERGAASYHGMLRLFEQLEGRGYDQFEVAKQVFADEDHCSVIAPSFAAGLKFALRTDQFSNAS
jgi:hypothetical protein